MDYVSSVFDGVCGDMNCRAGEALPGFRVQDFHGQFKATSSDLTLNGGVYRE